MEIFAIPMLGRDGEVGEEINIHPIGDGFKMKGTSKCGIRCSNFICIYII